MRQTIHSIAVSSILVSSLLFSARSLVAQAASAPAPASAQQQPADQTKPDQTKPDQKKDALALPDTPGAKGDRIHYDTKKQLEQPSTTPPPAYGQQPKRIMGWIPNYRAVSVDAKLPPPTMRVKFTIATENTVDYSAFIYNAVDTLVFDYLPQTYPEFGTGAVGYGRYYWRGLVDKGIGNYMTIAIMPTLTREDTRYYTLGRGHWYVRALYAYSRVLITPNDAGRNTLNISEIVGQGAAAGLGNLYYPAKYRTWSKTEQRWWVQVAIRDGGFDLFREFWPDVSAHVFHHHQ